MSETMSINCPCGRKLAEYHPNGTVVVRYGSLTLHARSFGELRILCTKKFCPGEVRLGLDNGQLKVQSVRDLRRRTAPEVLDARAGS